MLGGVRERQVTYFKFKPYLRACTTSGKNTIIEFVCKTTNGKLKFNDLLLMKIPIEVKDNSHVH